MESTSRTIEYQMAEASGSWEQSLLFFPSQSISLPLSLSLLSRVYYSVRFSFFSKHMGMIFLFKCNMCNTSYSLRGWSPPATQTLYFLSNIYYSCNSVYNQLDWKYIFEMTSLMDMKDICKQKWHAHSNLGCSGGFWMQLPNKLLKIIITFSLYNRKCIVLTGCQDQFA